MIVIEQNTIGKAWQEAYNHIKDNGKLILDEDKELLEILHLNLIINDPSKIDEIQQSQQGPMKEWMDKNFSEVKKVPELNDSWSYGWRLYNFNGVNQLEWIIEKLKEKRESKSATISMLNVAGSESYIACVSLLDFKIRDNALILTTFCRSLDFGNKAIHNFSNLAEIVNKVASDLNIKKTHLIIEIASAHLYKEDLK